MALPLRFDLRRPVLRLPAVAVRLVGGVEVREPVLVTVPADLWLLKSSAVGRTYTDEEGEYRWITVHPHGEGTPGNAVKLRPSKTEKNTWHVVGGAGGRLNYMRITGLATPEEYAERQREKRRVAREKKTAAKAAEKARRAGLSDEQRATEDEAKRVAAEKRKAAEKALDEHRGKIIAQAAEAFGWKPEEYAFDEQRAKLVAAHAKPERIESAERAWNRAVLAKVRQGIEATKKMILADGEVARAWVSQAPVQSDDPDIVALTDVLDRPPLPKGKGYRSPVGEQAERTIDRELAERKGGELRAQLTELEKTVEAARERGDLEPEHEADLQRMRGDVHIADLVAEATTLSAEEVAKEREDLDAATRAAVAEQQQLVPELRALQEQKDADPEQLAELRTQAANLDTRLRALKERAADLDVIGGEVAKWALKPEADAIQTERMLRRKDEITKERGAQAGNAFEQRWRDMQARAQAWYAETRYLKEAGALEAPKVKPKPVPDPDKVLHLVAAAKKLRAAERALAAAESREEAPDDRLFGKPGFIRVSEPSEAEVKAARADIEKAIATRLTQSFLEKAESPELLLGHGAVFDETYTPETLHQAMERHLASGVYDALNTAGLAATRTAVLSREVVDTLGAHAAAQLLATTLAGQESPAALRAMADRLGAFHVDENVMKADERVRAAEKELAAADAAIADLNNPRDLAVAIEANKQRHARLEEARRVIGEALGKSEATAALVHALGQGAVDEVHTALGPIDTETALRQLRALGLAREDYTITSDGTNQFATIRKSGFAKLAAPVDLAHVRMTDEVLAIKRGERDDPKWVAKGAAIRPSTTFRNPGNTPPAYRASAPEAAAWKTRADLENHVAARVADGEAVDDIVADMAGKLALLPEDRRNALDKLLTEMFPVEVPHVDSSGQQRMHELQHVVDGVMQPVLDEQGNVVKVPAFRNAKASERQADVDAWTERWLGEHGFDPKTAPMNAQGVDVDDPQVHEALFRGLAEEPRALAAFTPVGELTSQHQRAIRSYFASEFTRGKHAAGQAQKLLEKRLASLGPAPEKYGPAGLALPGIGDVVTQEYAKWKADRDAIIHDSQFIGGKGSEWEVFVRTVGGPAKAYAIVQDHMRSKVLHRFHQAYSALSGKSLRLGIKPVEGADVLGHYFDPKARKEMKEQLAKEQAHMRDRAPAGTSAGGQFLRGGLASRMQDFLRHNEATRQAQRGFDMAGPKTEPGDTDRWHLGQRLEGQLASLIPNVGKNLRWDAGKVDLLPDRSFTDQGGRLAQRAIKAFETSKRLAVTFGTGTGKTAIGINAFTHLKAQGKAQRALFLVPASTQGQWTPEIARMADPTAATWAANTDADYNQRLAEHQGSADGVVHSHQTFRDDQLKLLAQHWKLDEDAARDKFLGLDRKAAAAALKDAWQTAGVKPYDMVMVDEGHTLLDREGKPDSVFSRVVQAASDNAPYYMSASADAVKNDLSELRSLLSKLVPDGRYEDEGEWRRRYGVDTTAAREALQREVAPWVYAADIPSKNVSRRERITVPLTPWQQTQYANAVRAYEKVRAARLLGKVDVEQAKLLAPAAFEGKPEAEHEAIAKHVGLHASSYRDQAFANAIDDAPREHNAKIGRLVELVRGRNVAKQPMVVFAHRRKAVAEITAAMRELGHPVEEINGSVPKKQREAIRQRFQNGETHILVCTDAAEMGLNLPRGQCLVQYDRPLTAKAQPLAAPVLTPTGWRPIGDLCVGDPVIAGDGTVTAVTGVYPQGQRLIYRVGMSDGTATETCDEHLWLTRTREDRRMGRGGGVRTLADIRARLLVGGRPNHEIPLVGPAALAEQPVPLDGYLLGLLLGDGCFQDRAVGFTSFDEELVEAMRRGCALVGAAVSEVHVGDYRLVGNGGHAGVYPRRLLSPVLDAVRGLGLGRAHAWEKFVPTAYLWNGPLVRLGVLQGLLDTDGTIDRRTGSVSFTSTSPRLIADVRFLVRSLGGVVGQVSTGMSDGGRPAHRITIALPAGLAPFRLTRKAALVRPRTRRPVDGKAIVSAEPIGEQEARCIAVAHPGHLYVTTDFIVTHNTHAQREGRIDRKLVKVHEGGLDYYDLATDSPYEARAQDRLDRKYDLRSLLSDPADGLDDQGMAAAFLQARHDAAVEETRAA